MLKGTLEGWDVSAEVAAISDRFRGLPGVMGVFWGEKRQGGAWLDRPAICVHVARKRAGRDLPESERLPASLDGYSIDVLEVGEIRAHTVDVRSEVRSGHGPRMRRSTLSAVMQDDGVTYALLSGHGTLPYSDGRIRSFYGPGDGPNEQVQVVDVLGTAHRATLLQGRLGANQPVDFAIARLDPGPAWSVNGHHPATECGPPFPLFATLGADRMKVRHFSRVIAGRDPIRRGRLRQVASSTTRVTLPDGVPHDYTGALVIDSLEDGAFSKAGDSGSLVTSEDGRVIGTVFAGSTTRPVSFLLPIGYLAREIGPMYWKFFRGSNQ
ncbi:hypothetical protein [Sorangium sp. So ce426]